MKNYSLFLVIAATTVFSPGPGVTLTLTNALRYGVRKTLGGILGIAFGNLIIALVSATGMGLLLSTSVTAFLVLKYLGAAYLIFLGLKMWRSRPSETKETENSDLKARFIEALGLQLSNPQAILFFVAVFPQFINPAAPYVVQFSILALTFCSLVVIIHFLYAMIARSAKKWLASPQGAHAVSKIGSGVLILFGLGLVFTT